MGHRQAAFFVQSSVCFTIPICLTLTFVILLVTDFVLSQLPNNMDDKSILLAELARRLPLAGLYHNAELSMQWHVISDCWYSPSLHTTGETVTTTNVFDGGKRMVYGDDESKAGL